MSEVKKVHVVMLPWLAFGHMIPFLDLSIALAKQGVRVSFLSTPANIRRLPTLPPNLSQYIEFVPFPLPKLDSNPLPENAEATVDIPADKIERFKIACDALQHPIREFITDKRPNWIVVDFLYHWVADIAQEFEIPIIFYKVFCATSTLYFFLAGDQAKKESRHHLTVAQKESSNVEFKDHEASAMHDGFHGVNASGISDSARIARVLAACRAVAIRSCNEFEGDSMKLYSEKSGKEIIPVGILPPEIQENAVEQEPWVSIFGWLDKQKPKSVVFVGFGSETKLKREIIHEIAYGLEKSRLPFLWALRNSDEIEEVSVSDVLPAGFFERTAAQGVVQMGWALQREVLGHRAIGASLFHAGWGSIIEAMQFGHVLVFLPWIIDQPLNARMMVEKGLGIEVERAEDGSFVGEDVATALNKAMASHELRARAERAAHHIFTNFKLHQDYVDNFVHYLNNN